MLIIPTMKKQLEGIAWTQTNQDWGCLTESASPDMDGWPSCRLNQQRFQWEIEHN